jgi:hypothetical protein
MFAKTDSYFCDAEAVKVKSEGQNGAAASFTRATKDHLIPNQAATQHRLDRDERQDDGTANPRSVWTIGPQPLKHKHYAAYPEELPRRCILAGTPDKGCCPKCGSPWARMVERVDSGRKQKIGSNWDTAAGYHGNHHRQGRETQPADQAVMESRAVGWLPTCDCNAGNPVPCTVLDPFGGSGTTAIAARMMGRNAISCELNPEYVAIMARRDAETAPLLLATGERGTACRT